MISTMQNLKDFINGQSILPCDSGEMTAMMDAVAEAAVRIHGKVVRAGLINILGAAGVENVQGEEQQKLDVLANDIMIDCLAESKIFAAAASEENENIIAFKDSPNAPYIIAFDPLDGSSNIDVNVSIGTIFSIYQRPNMSKAVSAEDFFQVGDNQLAAGYVIYGTSTMMVMTTGNGLNGFTMNPDDKEFYLTHDDMCIPESGRIYSINEGNFASFPAGLKRYLSWCKSEDNDKKSPYAARYIGSMVADMHRNFLKGGVFLYPATSSSPKGKLRLLYECHPMAFLAEAGGGQASTGTKRLLDLEVKELHQRTPIIVGSTKMVDKVIKMLENPDQS